MARLQVAVVGGGIFGVSAAVELARAGHRVDLFEQAPDLLTAASGINQYRLHRGYHYPRSDSTASSSLAAAGSFMRAYGPAVVSGQEAYYAIGQEGSLTTADAYMAFCRRLGLPFTPGAPPFLRKGTTSLSVRVVEDLFDPTALRRLAWERLRESGVRVRTSAAATPESLRPYDLKVLATYARLNNLVRGLGFEPPIYQFEVCEKPVARMPEAFHGRSLVVMDGPFMCVDPLGRSDLSVMGHVVHAIHATNEGTEPHVPAALRPLLDRGIVAGPRPSNFPRFLRAGAQFMEGFEEAEHIGSMYTVRAVLPKVDRTDERPTLVTRLADDVLTVFSGKIGTSVEAGLEIAALAEQRKRQLAGTAGAAP